MSIRWQCACRAIQGARDYQEDAAGLWIDARNVAYVPGSDAPKSGASDDAVAALAGGVDSNDILAILADGMGGHVGGSEASKTACNAFAESFAGAEGKTEERLDRALDAANEAIVTAIHKRPELAGMGCTLIGVSLSAEALNWVSVGDSLLYLFSEGTLTHINENHSLGPMLDKMAEEGEITPEQAAEDPRRHHLLSAIMGTELEFVDLSQIEGPRQPGDIILLASDGIESLSHDDISDIVKAEKDEDAGNIADALLSAVNNAGHPYQDNTTLVVMRALPLS